MKIIKQDLPADHNLFLFGDDHEGSILRHDDGWLQLVDMMHSEYGGVSDNFGVDHGDIIEAIMIDDPRYDGLTTEGNILHQMQRAVEHRKPIKDKLVCILEGNHPLKLWRFGKITEEVCRQLGVQYGTWSCKINYTLGERLQYKHYAIHGTRKSINSVADDPKRRRANMELSLKRSLAHKAGDAILMSSGHTHKLIYCAPEPQLYLTDDGHQIQQHYSGPKKKIGYIHPDYRHYLNCGSFYRLYADDDNISGYAEIAGYDPVELGFWIVRVRDCEIAGVDKVILEGKREMAA